MRTPTPRAELYGWHSASLEGRRPPVREDEPQCGWFRFRMVRGGPWIPARIWCDRSICARTGELESDERLRCDVLGYGDVDPLIWWARIAGKPISRAAYDALVRDHADDPTMSATHVARDISKEPARP